MHKIALEPKELYTLWADGRAEEVASGRHDPSCTPQKIVFSCGVAVGQPEGGL